MPKNNCQGITILMPTFKQASFISRAIRSLQLQEFTNWELIIIDDGSPDDTEEMVYPFLKDKRIRYSRNKFNRGLGACLNEGLRRSTFDFIAYLPSDDVFYRDHLQVLFDCLHHDGSAVLACSAVTVKTHGELPMERRQEKKEKDNRIQLVQVLHRKTEELWMERAELVTDDYRQQYWDKLEKHGRFVYSDKITCEWLEHPEQLSKIINESFGGGLYKYKLFYGVSEPLKFHSAYGNYIDEASRYERFRGKEYKKTKTGLKILLVGELAFNPERICALEERGHQLYGLWMRAPLFFNTVGPLAFGNVEDVPYNQWKRRVKKIKPDIIYALLNWQTVTFAHEIIKECRDIPFVWHFKEDPFFCIKKGLWQHLFELYTFCDGRVFTNQYVKDWFELGFPDKKYPSHILDGDLPKKDWFLHERSIRLSEKTGEIHTVLPGRPFGFKPEYIKLLAEEKIHLHFYGELYQAPLKEQIEGARSIAGDYFHIHPNCDPKDWLKEFSQYDAGWLHLFESRNGGELMRSEWNDLNYPARLATYAVAGLPMLHLDNTGHLVATESLMAKLDIGVPFKNIRDLAVRLRDRQRMDTIRENVWNNRELFLFDTHAAELIRFFRQVIKEKKKRNR
ncbi:glycosyltransferase family 2 protein [Flavitalea flava]